MTVLDLKQDQLSQLRDALARLPKDRSRRIPKALRHQLAEYAQQRMAAGESRLALCRALGIGDATLVRALQSKPGPKLVPIELSESPDVPPENSPEVTVRGPGGLTIEGLDVEGVVKLLRGLKC